MQNKKLFDWAAFLIILFGGWTAPMCRNISFPLHALAQGFPNFSKINKKTKTTEDYYLLVVFGTGL